VVFLSPFRHMLGMDHKIRPWPLLLHPFQFIIHLSFNSMQYRLSYCKSIVKQSTNK
jgi:hypothetical protein